MPLLLPALAHPAVHGAIGVLAATSTKKSSGSPVFFIFLIVIVGLYFLFIAPQRRKQRALASQQATYEVGDEVVTKGGIFGRVLSMDGDRVRLETSPGVFLDVLTASVARRVEPAVEEEPVDEYPAPGADGIAAHDGTGTSENDASGWTEPAHEGWSEPVHEGASDSGANGRARGDAASGGPS